MVTPAPVTLDVPHETPPDEAEDKPFPGVSVTPLDGPLKLPSLIMGAGTFSNQYNTDEHLASFAPMRLIRLALRYGIRAIDTSIYYGPSEVVVGNALKMIRDEFPRSSYQLMTKCGRFGATTFDYSPAAIRRSVTQSLQRLQTDYLDTVYLHDVEFVCDTIMPKTTGHHASALTHEKEAYGLLEGQESKVHGEGDRKVLEAFAELQKMKDEGLVKNIGITGYPLPTLLRIALLILHTHPYKPVDVVLSYSHISLQNTTFADFAPELRGRARVGQLVAASPFSMGLLTPSIPPWHPSPPDLRDAVSRAKAAIGNELVDLALSYSIRRCGKEELDVPLVIGLSNLEEVHAGVKVWREVQSKAGEEVQKEKQEAARQILRESGFLDWSWASP